MSGGDKRNPLLLTIFRMFLQTLKLLWTVMLLVLDNGVR